MTPEDDIRVAKATESLELRILKHTVASCSCMTKTNNIMYHDPDCLYRVLTEVLEILAPDSFVERRP